MQSQSQGSEKSLSPPPPEFTFSRCYQHNLVYAEILVPNSNRQRHFCTSLPWILIVVSTQIGSKVFSHRTHCQWLKSAWVQLFSWAVLTVDCHLAGKMASASQVVGRGEKEKGVFGFFRHISPRVTMNHYQNNVRRWEKWGDYSLVEGLFTCFLQLYERGCHQQVDYSTVG